MKNKIKWKHFPNNRGVYSNVGSITLVCYRHVSPKKRIATWDAMAIMTSRMKRTFVRRKSAAEAKRDAINLAEILIADSFIALTKEANQLGINLEASPYLNILFDEGVRNV